MGLGYRLTAATSCVLILEGVCQQDKAVTTAHVFLNIFGPNRIIKASKCAATNVVKMSRTSPAYTELSKQFGELHSPGKMSFLNDLITCCGSIGAGSQEALINGISNERRLSLLLES